MPVGAHLSLLSGHGVGAAASEDDDGSPQSWGRGKITSAIISYSSRAGVQMEYEDRSLVLLWTEACSHGQCAVMKLGGM